MEQERVNEIVKVLTEDPTMRVILKYCCNNREERIAFLSEMVQAIY